ncbi:MerR family transcriptional regulator [Ochrobactrum sp. WV_118_8]|uniref:MerR family transcriptional regulator n=1 Tax=Stappia indica TaxID=538381 RepID=A0A857C8F5_9HYPH|nr:MULTISPECIES: MerR family transcriptional regulator [Hyphomicrobiales]QGZ35274.1 MerR family transcriptional regulator [Stappia indica]WKT92963.1 MerR family transcriptional regulator [Brucella anthropi]
MSLSIGDMSEIAGVKVPTIRYYEEIGLLRSKPRNKLNHRRYDNSSLMRLIFIREARMLGFDIDIIRDFLRLSDGICTESESMEILSVSLKDVRNRIRRLQLLSVQLNRIVKPSTSDAIPPNNILTALS